METGFDPVSYLLERPASRFLLGITGPPGAGKSTYAARLASRLADQAIVLPMDGFHMKNAELDMRGLRDRKGAPDTYDVAGFVSVLTALRGEGVVLAPAYSRTTHEPEPEAIRIEPSHRFVLAEGNYLLTWQGVQPCLDEVWYLDVGPDTARERLIGRHLAVGRSRELAEAKVANVDLPNGEIVARTKHLADRVIDSQGSSYL